MGKVYCAINKKKQDLQVAMKFFGLGSVVLMNDIILTFFQIYPEATRCKVYSGGNRYPCCAEGYSWVCAQTCALCILTSVLQNCGNSRNLPRLTKRLDTWTAMHYTAPSYCHGLSSRRGYV